MRTRAFIKNFFVLITFFYIVGGVWGATYPDTATCATTPTIDFPSTVTITKNYLFVAACATSDFNSGDFVTAWVEDSSGSPVLSISRFIEHDAGVEWVSPLTDNTGKAWEHIEINPELFDCNSTGIPYTIQVYWDAQNKSQSFDVVCPTLIIDRYKRELPYGQNQEVIVSVKDDLGYKMPGLPCESILLDVTVLDGNMLVMKEKHERVFTDNQGKASFTFVSGITNTLLVDYNYLSKIECMGGDVNIEFQIKSASSESLRNPFYYGLLFIGQNIVLIFLVIIVLLVTSIIFYKILIP